MGCLCSLRLLSSSCLTEKCEIFEYTVGCINKFELYDVFRASDFRRRTSAVRGRSEANRPQAKSTFVRTIFRANLLFLSTEELRGLLYPASLTLSLTHIHTTHHTQSHTDTRARARKTSVQRRATPTHIQRPQTTRSPHQSVRWEDNQRTVGG